MGTTFKLETSYFQQCCQQYSTVQEGFSCNNSTIPAQLETISLFPVLSMTCWYLHLPENSTKVKHLFKDKWSRQEITLQQPDTAYCDSKVRACKRIIITFIYQPSGNFKLTNQINVKNPLFIHFPFLWISFLNWNSMSCYVLTSLTLSLSPFAPVASALSLPARSTKLNLLTCLARTISSD